MLKNSLMFLVIILLTACQHPPEDGIKRYPRLTLVLLKQLKCRGEGYREYSVRVVNAGIDVYIIIDNGYNEFMTVDKLSLYGNRCGYESQGSCSFLRCSQYIYGS